MVTLITHCVLSFSYIMLQVSKLGKPYILMSKQHSGIIYRGGFKGGPTGPGPPHSAPTVLYARAMTLAVMAKKQQKRLTAWLSVDEEPAKRTRQDDNRAVVEDAPLVAGGGDEASVSPALMSDSSTCSRFDPSSLTLPNSVGPDNPSTRLKLC